MKLFVIGHTGIAIGLAVIPLLVVLALVWRCGRSARITAAVLGFAWAIVTSAYFAYIMVESGEFLDRKNFIFLPVESIMHDISTTAESGDIGLTKKKLDEFQTEWNTICMTTNDPWIIQEKIKAIGNTGKANK